MDSPKASRSELLTYYLLSRSLVELSQSPTQNLALLQDLAKVLRISPADAFQTFRLIMAHRKDVPLTDLNFQDPGAEAFDKIFDPEFKYQPVVQTSSRADMKNWDRVNVEHIYEKTKQKRGIQDFIQLIEQQKQTIQRKRLQNIQAQLKQQLQAYAEYIRNNYCQ